MIAIIRSIPRGVDVYLRTENSSSAYFWDTFSSYNEACIECNRLGYKIHG